MTESFRNFLSLSFVFIFIFSRSIYKVQGLEWAIGLIISLLMISWYLLKGIKKYALIGFFPTAIIFSTFVITTGFHFYIEKHIVNFITVIVVWIISFSYAYLYSEKKLDNLEKYLIISWSLISITFLIANFLEFYTYRESQFSAHFENRNNYAVATCVVLYLFSTSKVKINFFYFICFTVLSLAIIYTKSLTGIIFLFFILFFYFIKTKFAWKVIIILSVPIFLSILYFSYQDLQDRVNAAYFSVFSPSQVDAATSGRARILIAKEGIKLFSENPLKGVGVHNSQEYIKPNLGTGMYNGIRGYDTHNNYLELAISGGIIPLLFFYLPLGFSLFIFLKNKQYHYLLGCLSLFTISFVTRLFEFLPLMFMYYSLLLISLQNIKYKSLK